MKKNSLASLSAVFVFLSLLLGVLLGEGIVSAQQPPAASSPASQAPTSPPTQGSSQSAPPASSPSAADKDKKTDSTPPNKDKKADAPAPPYKLSPAEKEKLLASVDEVLHFAS